MQHICLLIPGVFSLVIHRKYYKLNNLLDNFLVYLMYNYINALIMNIFLNFFSVNKYIYEIDIDDSGNKMSMNCGVNQSKTWA